jgi:hypothetical protein
MQPLSPLQEGAMAGPKRRRRAVVLGVPAVLVAVLAFAALWRLGVPAPGESGAAGTMGLNPDRRASLSQVEVRQLTSDRTFWVGEGDEDPVFVVSLTPVHVEPGSTVAVTGSVEPAPSVEMARRAWGVNDATARAVHERGVYVRATDIRVVR